MQERQETKTFSFKYSRVYFTTHRSFHHDLRITFGRWAPISFEMAQCLRIMNRIHVTGILKRLNAWKYKLWRKLAHKQIFIFKSLAMTLRPNQFRHQRKGRIHLEIFWICFSSHSRVEIHLLRMSLSFVVSWIIKELEILNSY